MADSISPRQNLTLPSYLPSDACKLFYVVTGEQDHGFCSSRVCLHTAVSGIGF